MNAETPAFATPLPALWSVVVPYFNEEAFLGATLASLGRQSAGPIRFVLVDNASTDGSAAVAKAFAAEIAARGDGSGVVALDEARPGKASALKRGLAAVTTPYVAICDADTYYPPDYLRRAQALFEAGGTATVAVLAFGAPVLSGPGNLMARAKGMIAATLMPRQTHSGGYGQSFRTEDLKAVGGFSPDIWPYCLMDHEIMNRLVKRGRLKYAFSHWCLPSARRANRRRVRWTLPERLLYHVLPHSRKDWFFNAFLAERFKARGVSELNLRRKEWGPDAAP